MPDGGLSWYINDVSGKQRYEDMFFRELIPFIEKTYRIRVSREFRAIAGLSMGGNGALMYAMKHPFMFSACVALSAEFIQTMKLKVAYKRINMVLSNCSEPCKAIRFPSTIKITAYYN